MNGLAVAMWTDFGLARFEEGTDWKAVKLADQPWKARSRLPRRVLSAFSMEATRSRAAFWSTLMAGLSPSGRAQGSTVRTARLSGSRAALAPEPGDFGYTRSPDEKNWRR